MNPNAPQSPSPIDPQPAAADGAAAYWRYAILGVILLAAAMRLIDLGAKSIWFDETHTYNDAFRDYAWLRRPHVFYYLIVKWFLLIGGMSDYWLRLPSALFGVMGVYVIYRLADEIFDDRRTALMSAIFTCCSVTHLDFSQEARYYAAIFFWSALSLYLLARFFRRGSFICLVLLPIVCLLNYFTHPVTLVLTGVIMGWIPIGFAATAQGRLYARLAYKYVKETISSPSQNTNQAAPNPGKTRRKRASDKSKGAKPDWRRWAKLTLMLAGLLVMIAGSWPVATRIIRGIPAIKWFSNPVEGAEWTWDFFYVRHFLPYGPGDREFIAMANPLNRFLIMCYAVLAVIGYGRALIKRGYFASLALVSAGLSFSLLFSMGYAQYHHYKYLFFLFPMHIACMMYGLSGLAGWAARLASVRGARAALLAGAAALAVFWLPNAALWSKALATYYKGERIGAKPALRAALADFNPEKDVIAGFGVTTWVFDYYAKLWNIPRERFIGVVQDKGDGSYTIARIRRAARLGGRIWFLDAWQHDRKARLTEWVKENFDLAMTVPSFIGRDRDTTLWKWKYENRVVSSQSIVTTDCPISAEAPAVLPGEAGLDGVFYNYLDRECLLTAHLPDAAAATSHSLTLHFAHGASLPLAIAPERPGVASGSIMLPSGPIRVWCELRPALPSGPPASPMPLTIVPVDKDVIQYRAAAFDDINPSTDYIAKQVEQGIILELPFNNSVAYYFDVPQPGRYHVGLRAVNDSPGPIVFQVDVDSRPAGLLSYDKADQSVSTKMFPVTLAEGRHAITYSFITDYFRGGDLPDNQDNDAFLERVFIQELTQNGRESDQRVLPSLNLIVELHRAVTWPPTFQKSISGAWSVEGYEDPQIETIEADGIKYPSFTGGVLFDRKSAQAISSPVPIKPGDLIYFSARVRTKELLNHVANIQLVFFDKNGQMTGQRWVNGQGVLENSDDVKIIAFAPAPSNAAMVVIALCAYSRGQKLYSSKGQVWFYDFQTGREILNSMNEISKPNASP